jgi:hypothetical protein
MADTDVPEWITRLEDRDLLAMLKANGRRFTPCNDSTRPHLQRGLAGALRQQEASRAKMDEIPPDAMAASLPDIHVPTRLRRRSNKVSIQLNVSH